MSRMIMDSAYSHRAIANGIRMAPLTLLMLVLWANADTKQGNHEQGGAVVPRAERAGVDQDTADLPATGGSSEAVETSVPLSQPLEGEDVGSSSTADPLVEIEAKMRSVEQRMYDRRIGSETRQIQKQILRDLTALIDARTDASQSQSPSASADNQSVDSQTSANAAGQTSSSDVSSPRVGSATLDQADENANQTYPRESWGELPERFWRRLQSADADRFLPKYEKLIEQYYKTLAESEVIP